LSRNPGTNVVVKRGVSVRRIFHRKTEVGPMDIRKFSQIGRADKPLIDPDLREFPQGAIAKL
jgi:hypothetical protein